MRSLFFTLIIVMASTFTSTSQASDHPPPSLAPETALKWMINGNIRFNKSHLRRDGQARVDVKRLSSGQAPHTIVLSCSDSRVPPEIVFDQKLGEIFTVRTAGQALDDNAIGSIEYAVEHLGAHLILVMGHSSCGAVKAAFGSLDGSTVGTPALDALVKDIHPRLASFKGKPASAGMLKESWANTEGVAQDLVARSTLLSEKWKKGEIWIVPSLYSLDNGKVDFHANLKPKTKGAATNQ